MMFIGVLGHGVVVAEMSGEQSCVPVLFLSSWVEEVVLVLLPQWGGGVEVVVLRGLMLLLLRWRWCGPASVLLRWWQWRR